MPFPGDAERNICKKCDQFLEIMLDLKSPINTLGVEHTSTPKCTIHIIF